MFDIVHWKWGGKVVSSYLADRTFWHMDDVWSSQEIISTCKKSVVGHHSQRLQKVSTHIMSQECAFAKTIVCACCFGLFLPT